MKGKKLILPTLLLLALGTAACGGGGSAPAADPRTSPEGENPGTVAPSGSVAPVYDCTPLQGSYLDFLNQQADAQETALFGATLQGNVLQIQGQLPGVETCALPGDFSSYGLTGPVRDPSCVAQKLGEMEAAFSQALSGTGTSFAAPYHADVTALTSDVNYFRQIGEDAAGIDAAKAGELITNHNNWLAQVNSTQANLDTTNAHIANAPGIIQPKYEKAVQLFNSYSEITLSNPGLVVSEEEQASYQALLKYSEGIRTELNGLLQELYGSGALIPAPPAETSMHLGNWSFETGEASKYLESFTPQMTGAENNGFCLIGCPPELENGSLFQQYDSLLDSVPGLAEQLAKETKEYVDARDALVKSLGIMAFSPLAMTVNPAQIQATATTYSNTAQSYNAMLAPIQQTLIQNGCEIPVLEAAP